MALWAQFIPMFLPWSQQWRQEDSIHLTVLETAIAVQPFPVSSLFLNICTTAVLLVICTGPILGTYKIVPIAHHFMMLIIY